MSNTEIAVIYHENCNDGYGAAYAAWLTFKEQADYIPMGYNTPLDLKKIKGKDLYVVDFCFSPDEIFNRILPEVRSVTILDHHLSSKDEWVRQVPDMKIHSSGKVHQLILPDRSLNVRFEMGKSGALMAWEHFNKDIIAPTFFQYISDADLYTFKLRDSKAFDMYLRGSPKNFKDWNNTDHELRTGILNSVAIGKSMLDYHNVQVTNLVTSRKVKEISFEMFVEDGIRVDTGYIINASLLFANDIGAQLAARKSTFGIIWETDGKTAFCSIRSVEGYDCIPIAKRFGGGGHERSCGFSMPLMDMYKLLNKGI